MPTLELIDACRIHRIDSDRQVETSRGPASTANLTSRDSQGHTAATRRPSRLGVVFIPGRTRAGACLRFEERGGRVGQSPVALGVDMPVVSPQCWVAKDAVDLDDPESV